MCHRNRYMVGNYLRPGKCRYCRGIRLSLLASHDFLGIIRNKSFYVSSLSFCIALCAIYPFLLTHSTKSFKTSKMIARIPFLSICAISLWEVALGQSSVPSDLSRNFDPSSISLQVSYDGDSANGFNDGSRLTVQRKTPNLSSKSSTISIL